MTVTIFPGDHSEEVTPVPIPNTEVKGLSGNGTVAIGCGRVARRRDFFSGLANVGSRAFFLLSIVEDRSDPTDPTDPTDLTDQSPATPLFIGRA